MLYSKSDNKKYTQMCIEFDKEFYEPNRDDNKLFKYLYLIFYMLACKGNYFSKFEDYDGYAQYSATEIYKRYLKKEKKGVRIKSVLNYAKSCKKHLKTDYQNETFEQVTKEGDERVQTYQHVYRENISDDYSRYDIAIDTEDILNKFPKIAQSIVDDTPYRQDKLLCKHLYISCLLTFLNDITFSNQILEKLNAKQQSKDISDNFIIKQYQKNLDDEPILWRLSIDYADVVRMLINKIKSKMSEDINNVVASYTIPDDVIDAIISSAYDEKVYNDGMDDNYKY